MSIHSHSFIGLHPHIETEAVLRLTNAHCDAHGLCCKVVFNRGFRSLPSAALTRMDYEFS
eukprot:COSAG02_NODE_179_length_31090_cov_49.813785_9_plen_60_part_00